MSIDYQIFHWINQFAGSHPAVDTTVLFFTKYGGLSLLGLLLAILWFKKENQLENRKTVILALLAAGLALAINQIIGAFYFRPRPFTSHMVNLLVDKSIDPSFPSDHSTLGFALAIGVLLRNRKAGLGLLAVAFFLGLSRIYVGTHYPLDVMGGAATGILGIIAVKSQEKWIHPVAEWLIGQYKRVEGKVYKA